MPGHLRLAGLSLISLSPGSSELVLVSNMQIRCCVFLLEINFRFVGVDSEIPPPLYGFLSSKCVKVETVDTFTELGAVPLVNSSPLLHVDEVTPLVLPPPLVE